MRTQNKKNYNMKNVYTWDSPSSSDQLQNYILWRQP